MKKIKNCPAHFLAPLSVLLLFFFMNESKLKGQELLCGTTGGPDAIGPISEYRSSKGNGIGPYYINVYIHIIRKSDGTGGQTLANVNSAFVILNNDFNPHNIYFIPNCDIAYIDNDYYYSNIGSYCSFWQDPAYVHNDGIDLFLGPSDGVSGSIGVASGIPGKSVWIAGAWTGGIPVILTYAISHEMGHCLGLWHTFHGTYPELLTSCGVPFDDPNLCCELVNGSNGTSCGDYVEDTNADPYGWLIPGPGCSGYDLNCFYTQYSSCFNQSCPPFSDINEDEYNPLRDNIMSYNNNLACFHGFTTGQGMRMGQIIDMTPFLQSTLTSSDPPVLSVHSTISDPTPAIGDGITISVEVCNISGNQLNNIIVTEPLPLELQFGSSNDFQNLNGILTSQPIALSPGNCTTLTFIAKVLPPQQWCTVVNCASAQYSNNCQQISDCVEYMPEQPLSTQISVSNPNPSLGSTITISVEVCNMVPVELSKVYIINPLPSGLAFVNSSIFYKGGNRLFTPLFTLPPYDPGNPNASCITASFNAQVNDCNITNCAEVIYSSLCPSVTSCIDIDPLGCNPCGDLITVDHDCRVSSEGHNFDHITLNYMGHPIANFNDPDCCVTWEYVNGIPIIPCPRPNGYPGQNYTPVNLSEGQHYKVTIICGDCPPFVETDVVHCSSFSSMLSHESITDVNLRNTQINNTIENNILTIYPNPAKNEIAIRFKYDIPESENYTLKIFDIYGQQVMDYTLLGSTQWQVLNISSFSPGAYAWYLTSDTENRMLEQGKIIVVP